MKSQLKILEKAQRHAEKAGFSPKVVKMNLLVPLLEASSLDPSSSRHGYVRIPGQQAKPV